MKARKVSGDCEDGTCPAVYVTDQGTVLAQGKPVASAEGLTLGIGEMAVELPLSTLKQAVVVIEAKGQSL
jgi:hypothetical protein